MNEVRRFGLSLTEASVRFEAGEVLICVSARAPLPSELRQTPATVSEALPASRHRCLTTDLLAELAQTIHAHTQL